MGKLPGREPVLPQVTSSKPQNKFHHVQGKSPQVAYESFDHLSTPADFYLLQEVGGDLAGTQGVGNSMRFRHEVGGLTWWL